MSGSSLGQVVFDDLPEIIPIFPLTGALLLPRGRLPLNIFEPRYLAMVRDALAAERMIGMVQPTEHESGSQTPPLYSVGCLGKITSFSEADDGRFLITLTGLCRFHVAEELARITPYRKIVAAYRDFAGDMEQAVPDAARLERERLIPRLKAFLTLHGMDADWKAIETAPDEILINALAMICPFSASEKQALLEAPGLADRAQTMATLLEMALSARPGEPEGPLQ